MGHGWLSTLGRLGLPWAGRLRRRARARRGPAPAKREIASSPLQRGRATRLTAAGIGPPRASGLVSLSAALVPSTARRASVQEPVPLEGSNSTCTLERTHLVVLARFVLGHVEPGDMVDPEAEPGDLGERPVEADHPGGGQMIDAGLERKKAGSTAPSSVVKSWPGPQGPAPGGPDRPRLPDLRVVSAPQGADRRPPGRGPQGLLTLGFDPNRFQTEPPACYRASWQLPGPDSHRQATTS